MTFHDKTPKQIPKTSQRPSKGCQMTSQNPPGTRKASQNGSQNASQIRKSQFWEPFGATRSPKESPRPEKMPQGAAQIPKEVPKDSPRPPKVSPETSKIQKTTPKVRRCEMVHLQGGMSRKQFLTNIRNRQRERERESCKL